MAELLNRLEHSSKTHLLNIMRLIIFRLNDNNYYGINVSKIRSFEDHKRFEMIKNNVVKNPIVDGFIQYQKQVIPVLNIEKWLGIYTDENVYYEYMVCEYNRQIIAIPIAGVYNIVNVNSEHLQKPDAYRGAVTYNTVVEIEGRETICMVLDVEELLFDALGPGYTLDGEQHEFAFERKLLIAEDSHTAQEILKDILESTDVEFSIFSDGQEMIDYLSGLDAEGVEQIGMIITDLEMPIKDGYQVIKYVRDNAARYGDIPIVVNSSMSDAGVGQKTKSIGATDFVAKTDPDTIMNVIRTYMRR